MPSADRLIEIFNEAKARAAGAERDAFLAESCGDDAELKAQVLSLLGAHEGAGDFLKAQPALAPEIEAELARLKPEEAGDRIGPYKLREQIGEGGFGVVWVAEQQAPVRRTVALKIIKMGMDTREVVARFEQERQALALMDHPNIARVFDAGATEHGRPFFVMELVRGIKITEYCDQANLPTAERLALFIQVCQAVQHAHQKGIIHRDLKPSNILVTLHDGVPVPKVIDFGVAKATQGRLSEHTIYTQFQQMIGTPLYMSPEQAEMSGLDVDTRTDIYALGVLLYELLTGRTPFDADALRKAGYDEMRRIIREQEPQKPSTALDTMAQAALTTVAHHRASEPPKLIHAIRGDLDWIVMKTLEKDRTRRYETANGLAVDIQRHLDDEPVIARPPSNLYRFQKLVRRNKLAFAAGAAVLLVLLGGIAASTWQAIRATRAEREQTRLRQVAETEEKKSQQVAQFLKDMLKGVGPSVALGRDTTMLREIVDKVAERIGTDLKDQPEVEIELRLTLAQVYFDLQLYKKMAETARGTLRLARAHFGEENLAVADSVSQLGRALFFTRNMDEAEALTRQAIAMQRKLRGHDNLQEADSLCNLGDILRHQWYRSGRPEEMKQLIEAESAIRAGLAIRRSQLGDDNDEVAWALQMLRLVLTDEGKSNEAEAAIRDGLAIRRKIHGEEHPYTGSDYCALGDSLADQHKFDEAVTNYQTGLAILERTCGKGKWHQAWAHNGLANALAGQGRRDEAEVHYREALGIIGKEMGPNHPDLPGFVNKVANFLRESRKMTEAEMLLREALAAQRKLFGDKHLSVAACLANLSLFFREQGKLPEAESSAREALALRKELRGNQSPEVAEALHLLAWNLHLRGNRVEAEALSREELAMWKKLVGEEDLKVAWNLVDLTAFLREQGKLAEAEAAIRESLAIRRKKLGKDHPDTAYAFKLLSELLQKQGKPAETLQ
jgi:serine/threonine protein kinase/tetratricopeptide (TPR) repeat protein